MALGGGGWAWQTKVQEIWVDGGGVDEKGKGANGWKTPGTDGVSVSGASS
jgi:hypothetical protein